jgi:cytochrome P450
MSIKALPPDARPREKLLARGAGALSDAELLSLLAHAGPDTAERDAVWARAVEEVLRLESSNQLGNRRAVRDVQVGGIDVPSGALVTLCIGAANRDPAVFADPHTPDWSREPNRHLAFGLGIHQCAGLSLARLEGRIALGRFVQRFPGYQLTQPPVRGGRARFRGFLSAPFSVNRAA